MALKLAQFTENAVGSCTAVTPSGSTVRGQASLLLIDPVQAVLLELAETLAAAGYQCMCSTDEESAAECVRNLTPDLILSDINLAGHSGCAV